MTKAELIESIAEQGRSAQGPRPSEPSTRSSTTSSRRSSSGDKVNISGFGTFSVSERKARTGRNPKTGESIEIAASRVGEVQGRQDAQGQL